MATTSLVCQGNRSYYRSQLYTSYHGINPLVTAAHPLFSIIERIKLSGKEVIDETIEHNLNHELKAFETRAESADYDEETIFIAKYLLSTTLDEMIAKHKPFALFKELMPINNQPLSPDKNFFKILDKVIDKPQHYLDLLELIYLCLSVGYQGQYKTEEREKLAQVTENLYQTITPLRTSKKKNFFNTPQGLVEKEQTSWKKIVLISVTGLIALFAMSNYLLNEKASSLTTTLSVISETP